MPELGAVTRALLAIARDTEDDRVLAGEICRACVQGLDIDGAAISLLTADPLRETVFASDATADLLEDLQFSLGEGACIDAALSRRPVLVADMNDPAQTARWPVYAAAVAEQTGVRAIFALPLQWGAIDVGVLDLYRRAPGAFSAAQMQDALSAADAATLILLGLRSGPATTSRPGTGPGAIGRRSIRRPAWWWPSSGSARPTRLPGCAPTRSPSSGFWVMSPVMWWRGGCASRRTGEVHGE